MFFFLSTGVVFAQQASTDSLFLKIQKEYRSGDLNQALTTTKELLSQKNSSKNYDYALLCGRVFLANGLMLQADSLISEFWNEDQPNAEVLELLWRIAASQQKWKEAQKWSEKGLQFFPTDSNDWNWKKTIASLELNQTRLGLKNWNQLSDSIQFSQQGQSLKSELLRQLPRTIGVHWWNAQINVPQPLPWNMFQLEYGNKAKKLPWNVRSSYGAFFGFQAVQLELEAYPKIGKKAYGYVHVGLSTSGDLFPFARLSGEYFRSFSKGEWSLGGKYLHYSALQVALITAHVERNIQKEYTVGGRAYLGLTGSKFFPAQAIWLRKNSYSKERWVQADFQIGQIPYAWIFLPGVEPVFSIRTGFQAQIRIKDLFFVRPLLAYEREEYFPGRFRNRLNSQITLQYRF